MDALRRAVQLSSVLILLARLVLHYLIYADTSIVKDRLDQQTGLFAVVFAAVLLKMHAHPSGYLFDWKLMRLHLHTCVSNEVWFLFPVRRC